MGKIKHINLFMNFHDKTVLFDGKHFYRAILIKFHCTLDSLPNIAVIITRGILLVIILIFFFFFKFYYILSLSNNNDTILKFLRPRTDSYFRPESLPTFDLIR